MMNYSFHTRLLSLALAAVVCASSVPADALAEAIQTEQTYSEATVTEGDGSVDEGVIDPAQDSAEEENSIETILEEEPALAAGDVIATTVTDPIEMEISLETYCGDTKITVSGTQTALNGATVVEATKVANNAELSDSLEEIIEDNLVEYVAYDITLYTCEGGEAVEPAGNVNVVFENTGLTSIENEDCEAVVYHVDESEATLVLEEVAQIESSEAGSVEMITDHFSTYLIAITTKNSYGCLSVGQFVSLYENNNSWEKMDELATEKKLDWYPYREVFDYCYYLQTRVYATDSKGNVNLITDGYFLEKSQLRNLSFTVAEREYCNVTDIKVGKGTSYNPDSMTSVGNSKVFSISAGNFSDYKANKEINYIDIYLTTDIATVSGATLIDYSGDEFATAKTSDGQNTFVFNTGSGALEADRCHFGKIYQGLASNTLTDGRFSLAENLTQTFDFFPSKDKVQIGSAYKTAAYNANVEFVYKDGYYELDSAKYGYDLVSTDASNQFSPIGKVTEGSILSVKQETEQGGLWPFYQAPHYGMSIPLEFSIPADGLTNNEHTVFSFSGDDDVFVYIDGVLVLDIGGIHDVVNADIDFCTGQVSYTGTSNSWQYSGSTTMDGQGTSSVYFKKSDLNTNVYGSLYKDSDISQDELVKYRKKFSKSYHTMTVVYFERGANVSNCKIKYNFVPVNTPTSTSAGFTKVDENFAPIEGATFELYRAEDLTTSIQTAYSDVNGLVNFAGIVTGSYIIKETEAAEGYELPGSEVYWKLVVDEDLNKSITASPAAKEYSYDASRIKVSSETTEVAYVMNESHRVNLTKKLVINKLWEDDSDAYGTRPASIEVEISGSFVSNGVTYYVSEDGSYNTNSDTVYKTVTINSQNSNQWTYELGNVPVYVYLNKADNLINWNVTEKTVISEYTTEVEKVEGESPSATDTFNITNTLSNEYGDFILSIRKTVIGLSGLSDQEFREYASKLLFTVESDSVFAPLKGKKISGSQLNWSQTNGAWIGTYYFDAKDCKIGNKTYTYRIVETGAEVEGLVLTTKLLVSVDNNGKAVIAEDDPTAVVMKAHGNATFAFTNSYSSSNTTNELTNVSKTAEVYDYDNREYVINLSALSYDETVTTTSESRPVDVVFVFDTSKSMNFKTDLVEVNQWSFMSDRNTIYYLIKNDDAKTQYRVQYLNSNGKHGWYFIDDGESDTDFSNTGWKSYYKEDNRTSNINFTTDGKYYISSTGLSRMYYLKRATNEMIDKLPLGSKVSLVTFNRTATVNSLGGKVVFEIKSESDRISCKNSVEKAAEYKNLASGTDQGKGLEKAKDLLENNYKSDTVEKYVLLVTDGAPNPQGISVQTMMNNAKSYCLSMRNNEKAIIYAVGIDLSEGSKAKTLMRDCVESDKYWFSTSNSTDFSRVFASLAQTITHTETVYKLSAGVVTDVVDERFYLIADSSEVITKTPNGYISVGGHMASVTVNSDGTTTIIWYEDKLGTSPSDTVSSSDQFGNWTSSFKVVAKPDFMGGNIITTNTPDSRVTTPEKEEKFKEPSVNVKLLSFESADKEKTILLNESLAPSIYLKWLGDNATSDVTNLLMELTLEDIEKLFDGKTLSKDYTYGSSPESLGTIYYTLTSAKENDEYPERADHVGDDQYVYTLKIEYMAKSYEDRLTDSSIANNENLVLPTNGGEVLIVETTDVDGVTTYSGNGYLATSGSYKINVIAAEFDITKVGKQTREDAKLYNLNNATYLLTTEDGYIENEKAESYKLRANSKLEVTSATINDVLGQMHFANLGLGTYTLVETSAPDGYSRSGDVYTIVISKAVTANDYDVVVTKNSKDQMLKEVITVADDHRESVATAGMWNEDHTVVAFSSGLTVEDAILYELPNSGGNGVYVYTIGGVLLMLIALLLLYKNKKNNKK